MSEPPTIAPPLSGHELIVAVCGGIAAYKAADLVSRLVQSGCGVTVVMSDGAQRFITPLTFQALSGRPVRTSTWDLPDSSDPQHIALTEKADLMVVAPATANIIAKAATGICDEIVSLMICASACPVLFAPAMNNLMWSNPITQENVQRLKRAGRLFVGPAEGWLACRNIGPGRMSEPQEILAEIVRLLSQKAA